MADENRLRFYAQEQRLTGIILLDTDGRVQREYNGDLLNFLTLQEYRAEYSVRCQASAEDLCFRD